MQIRNIFVRGFRSIKNSSVLECGRLNVLIGKNNAGKSNVLATIQLVLAHLSTESIAGFWPALRPVDDFTDRDTTSPFEIIIEFDFQPDVRASLADRLRKEAPQLERSLDLVREANTISFRIRGACRARDGRGFLWVSDIFTDGVTIREGDIFLEGTCLLQVPNSVAEELFAIFEQRRALEEDLPIVEGYRDLNRERLEYVFRESPRRPFAFQQFSGARLPSSARVRTTFDSLLGTAKSPDEFLSSVDGMVSEIRGMLATLSAQQTTGGITAYAGEVRTPPTYALWLMGVYGAIRILHLRENKRPIGREEAAALLQLKVKRGGNERLQIVQSTVRSLLGVKIDAFEPEELGRFDRRHEGRMAELDVDEFLAEANGAGIREALRLILDLELKEPTLALIEEPEVHLHPGLERSIEGYLREKSQDVQIFLTTHSTNFVDAVSFRNVYLVARDVERKTTCTAVDSGSGSLSIPAELGLRLSTVFMYDRLVFVEGPTDEEILREFAKQLQVDLASANVGFVQMGGVRNFAHFAAQGTLDLLSRRQVAMWFVADRDERDDRDVEQMARRLGDKAVLKVLERRELENYLLDPVAIAAFLAGKSTRTAPTPRDVEGAMNDAATSLRDRVIELRVAKKLLAPLYVQSREREGSISERLASGKAELETRAANLETETAAISAEVDQAFPTRAWDMVPGTLILESVARRFGSSFRKELGDSLRLARHLQGRPVPREIEDLLKDISSAE